MKRSLRQRSTVSGALLTLLLATTGASAADRLPLRENVLLAASASEAWAVVGNFADLGAWHPAISKTEMANGEPTARGAVRVLTVGDNVGTVTETLTEFDNEGMSLTYVINSTDAVPVQDYKSTMRVVEIGPSTSMVVWSSTFQAKLPEGEPPESAIDAMRGVYRAGLDNLRDMLGK